MKNRKVWHSNDKYSTVIWRCLDKYDNDDPCKTPHVSEDQIKEVFVTEMNRVIAIKEQILADIRTLRSTLAKLSGPAVCAVFSRRG